MTPVVDNTMLDLNVARIENCKCFHHDKNKTTTMYGDGSKLHLLYCIHNYQLVCKSEMNIILYVHLDLFIYLLLFFFCGGTTPAVIRDN